MLAWLSSTPRYKVPPLEVLERGVLIGLERETELLRLAKGFVAIMLGELNE